MRKMLKSVINLVIIIISFRIKGTYSSLLHDVSALNLTIMDDMVLPNHVFNDISHFYLSSDSTRLWPNRRIPYRIDGKFTGMQMNELKKAIKWWHTKTCVRWVEKTKEDNDFIRVINSDGCASLVGKQGGSQNMWLGKGCFSVPTLTHEMMHATGFIHEHQRPDRDKFVKIFFENIQSGKQHNFGIVRNNLYSNVYGLAYDQNSVMHYNESAFSKGRGSTIIAKNGSKLKCNHLKHCPTDNDALKVNAIYKCK